jgi:segregation and condensation protein B
MPKRSRTVRPPEGEQTLPVPAPDTLPPTAPHDPSPAELGGMPPAAACDAEPTVDLTGGDIRELLRDDVEGTEARPADEAAPLSGEAASPTEPPPEIEAARALSHAHLMGLLEALVFASDKPMKAGELARLASAPVKQVREVLADLRQAYSSRGIVLDEIAGGWLFRTSAQYAPFVRELASERPVRLTRAQVETLAIAAYRQPITRPEIDDIRGVDSGATLKLLLERDLVRILGKKDEPGRPILYGTTTAFLELFGLKSLKDLPTLQEFTELSEDSRRVAEAELGDVFPQARPPAGHDESVDPQEAEGVAATDAETEGEDPHDTVAPPAPSTDSELEDPP